MRHRLSTKMEHTTAPRMGIDPLQMKFGAPKAPTALTSYKKIKSRTEVKYFF